jgi:DNA-binding MarR family transcriptional regulator
MGAMGWTGPDGEPDDSALRALKTAEAIATLPLLVRQANARFDSELRRVTRRIGHPQVGPAGVHLLRVMGDSGKPMTALAHRLGISRQAVGQAVKSLEEQGLATRREFWTGTLIVLTGDGRRLLDEVSEAVVDIVWTWGMVADGTRLDDLVRDLEVLAQNPRTRWG